MLYDKKVDVETEISNNDLKLLEIIHKCDLSSEDIKWLKNKRRFKKFIREYSKELKKRKKNIPTVKTETNDKIVKEEIEVLELSKTINVPSKEMIEVLDFAKNISYSSDEIIEELDFTEELDLSEIKDLKEISDKVKKRLKRKILFWRIIIGVSIIIFIVSLFFLLESYFYDYKITKVTNKINDIAQVKEIPITTTQTETENQEEQEKELTDYETFENISMLSVNFDALKNKNPDTVAWVNVPGTKINYPVVHYTDNSYYLKHSFDRSYNKKGWVFLDFRNNLDNLSKNNVIYAHGLLNNQMFGSMRNVIKPSWYNNKNNHYIKIATPSYTSIWQVFSTYTIEPESYYITTKFNNNEEFKTFIDTIKSRSVYDYNVEVTENDNIITLSSCYSDFKRMVLHAKLVAKQ